MHRQDGGKSGGHEQIGLGFDCHSVERASTRAFSKSPREESFAKKTDWVLPNESMPSGGKPAPSPSSNPYGPTEYEDEIDPARDLEQANTLCGDACKNCTEAFENAVKVIGNSVSFVTHFSAGCAIASMAVWRFAVAIRNGIHTGTLATLKVIVDCFAFRLQTPRELAVVERQVTSDVLMSEHLVLVIALCATALLLLIWDSWHGGIRLGGWVLLGGIFGAFGSLLGIAYAGLATPTEEPIQVVWDPRQWPLIDEYRAALLTVGAMGALTAIASGVVAWSMHREEIHQRDRIMWPFEFALLLACAIRQGYKTWRGCTRRGRMRLFVGGLGSCAPGWRWWPPLL